jgi:hypothetical protein
LAGYDGTVAEGTEPARRSSILGVALTVALASAFLAGTSLAVLIVDFGAHMDGPGIGLEWSGPLAGGYGARLGVVFGAMIAQSVLSLLAFSRVPAKGFGVLALPGVAFAGFIVGCLGAGRALPAWWKLGCDRGHAYACHAAAGITHGAESRALDERACAGSVSSACARIAREDPSRIPAICAARARTCAAPEAPPIYTGCRSRDDLCGTVDPEAK